MDEKKMKNMKYFELNEFVRVESRYIALIRLFSTDIFFKTQQR